MTLAGPGGQRRLVGTSMTGQLPTPSVSCTGCRRVHHQWGKSTQTALGQRPRICTVTHRAQGYGILSEALGALALVGLIRATLPTCRTEGRVVANESSPAHSYASHQCIPAAPSTGRAGMTSGRRGEIVCLDLSSSATRTWTVLATSPSALGIWIWRGIGVVPRHHPVTFS